MVIRNIEFRKTAIQTHQTHQRFFFEGGGVRILFCALRIYCAEAIAAARALFGARAPFVADAGGGAFAGGGVRHFTARRTAAATARGAAFGWPRWLAASMIWRQRVPGSVGAFDGGGVRHFAARPSSGRARPAARRGRW